jgi:Mn2+/Fe2+ NRAMP family transporter
MHHIYIYIYIYIYIKLYPGTDLAYILQISYVYNSHVLVVLVGWLLFAVNGVGPYWITLMNVCVITVTMAILLKT